mgnify:CR=1 FL=1
MTIDICIDNRQEITHCQEVVPSESKRGYVFSDGILNLLCWCTIYPNKFIAMFFRQLCLFGCGISKELNRNNVKTVYCCPLSKRPRIEMDFVDLNSRICCYVGNVRPHWRNPQNIEACFDNLLTEFIFNFGGHCCDHVHYIDNEYNSTILTTCSLFLWFVSLITFKTLIVIIYVIAAVAITLIFFVIFVILVIIFCICIIVTMILLPFIMVILLAIGLWQCKFPICRDLICTNA